MFLLRQIDEGLGIPRPGRVLLRSAATCSRSNTSFAVISSPLQSLVH
jgi:hypothetical protein